MIDVTDRSTGPPAEKETNRLEAFSDGVMAVIITIMVLELKAPVGATFDDLRQRLPSLLIYETELVGRVRESTALASARCA